MMEGGADPEAAYEDLVAKAIAKRGADVKRYARRTVEKATEDARGRLLGRSGNGHSEV